MAAGPTKLGRIYVKQQAAWGTKLTSFVAGDSMDVQGVFVPGPVQEALGQPVIRPQFGASPKQGGSKAGATAQVTWAMTDFTGTTPHVEHQLIADALGVLQAQAGIGTIAGTSTDGRLDVATANADWIGQGALVGLTGGGKQIVWVKDVDLTTTPDEVDITTAVATPDDAVSVAPTITIALTAGNVANLPFTMQFQTPGTNGGFRAWDGRVSSLTITANAKGQLTCAATLQFLSWESVDALTAGPFAFPRSQLGPNINAISIDGDTDSTFCFGELSIAITQALVEAGCNSAAPGVSQLVTSDRTVTITERLVAADLYAEAYQAPGTTTGARAWGLTSKGATDKKHAACLLAGQLSQVSAPVDLGGIWGVERVWEPTSDINSGDGTAGNSTVKGTRFRISFG
jgi:hypothetical protein